MVDGLHIHIQNKTMKFLATTLSGTRRGLWVRRRWWGWSKQYTMYCIMYIYLFRIVTMY
jgi:hypothetical protein